MRVAARATVVLHRTHDKSSLDLEDILGKRRGALLTRAAGALLPREFRVSLTIVIRLKYIAENPSVKWHTCVKRYARYRQVDPASISLCGTNI